MKVEKDGPRRRGERSGEGAWAVSVEGVWEDATRSGQGRVLEMYKEEEEV